MKVNLQIHLQPTENIVLNSVHTIDLKSNAILDRPHHVQNAIEIELAVIGTCIVRIALQIVHPISIDLT